MRLLTLETYRLSPKSPRRQQHPDIATTTPIPMPTQSRVLASKTAVAQDSLTTRSAIHSPAESELSAITANEDATAAAAAAAARFPKADRHIMPTFGPTTQQTPWPNHNLRYLVHRLEDLRRSQAFIATRAPTRNELERDSSVDQDITEARWTHSDDTGRTALCSAQTSGAALSTSQSQQRDLPQPLAHSGSSVSAHYTLKISTAPVSSGFKTTTAASYSPTASSPAAIRSAGSMFAQFGFDRDLDNIVPVPIVLQTPGTHTREHLFGDHSSASSSLPSSANDSPATLLSSASSPRTPLDVVNTKSLLEEPTPFKLDAGESEEDLVELMRSSAMLLGKLQVGEATSCELSDAVDMQDAGRVVF